MHNYICYIGNSTFDSSWEASAPLPNYSTLLVDVNNVSTDSGGGGGGGGNGDWLHLDMKHVLQLYLFLDTWRQTQHRSLAAFYTEHDRIDGFLSGAVREVVVVHVGGTRCVTSSTDHIMKRLARITLKVEVIRTCIFLFLFDVEIQ